MLFSAKLSHAQTGLPAGQSGGKALDSAVASYIRQLTDVWDEYHSLTFDDFFQNTGTTSAFPFYSAPLNFASENRKALLLKRNFLQQQIFKNDPGLGVNGGFQENLSAPFASPDEPVVFRRKLFFGFDWDILKAGWMDNRIRFKELQKEAYYINTYSNTRAITETGTAEQFSAVIKHFNNKKLLILEKRKDLMEKQHKVALRLWELKQITGDAYLKSSQHRTSISGQMNIYAAYNEGYARINGKDTFDLHPALFDLDFSAIMRHLDSAKISGNTPGDNAPPKGNRNYYNDISLKAFARYNYYDVFNSASLNRSFFSFGVTASAPLSMSYKYRNEIEQINTQLALAQNDNQLAASKHHTEYYILNLFYEYRYKLRQYFDMMENRKQLGELIRTEKVKQKLRDLEFNPNTAIYLLDDYWANSIELLDLHQQMYGIVINICEKLPGLKPSSVIVPAALPEESPLASQPVKAIYIWSKSFSAHDEDFISEYIKLNSFSDVLISFKNDKNYLLKLQALAKNNRKRNFHLMIGSNKVLENGIGNLLDSIKGNIDLSLFIGLHLDVEPQALDEYKDKKEIYLKKYEEIVNETSSFCKKAGLKLSLSVPLHFPESTLNALADKCDAAYLMAYENVKPEFIVAKSAEEQKAFGNKAVLALRAKDFAARDEMEKLFTELKIQNTAYHELESMVELDRKSVRVKDENDKTKGDK